jgi:hypothetical protein
MDFHPWMLLGLGYMVGVLAERYIIGPKFPRKRGN